MGCVSSRSNEAMQAIEEAIKENNHSRLGALLKEEVVTTKDLDRKNLLHTAAWNGYTRCVILLLQYGVDPYRCHRENGCTALHNAHFCTIADTDPSPTIDALVAAGADVNCPGGTKCGRLPIDHAVQHQRIDAVQALLRAGSTVSLQTLLIAIDVANPFMLETLLVSGGDCGSMFESTRYWGQPLHRVLYTPIHCPRKSYRQMFKLLLEATICEPLECLLQSMADSETGPMTPGFVIPSDDNDTAKAHSDNNGAGIKKDFNSIEPASLAAVSSSSLTPASSTSSSLQSKSSAASTSGMVNGGPVLRSKNSEHQSAAVIAQQDSARDASLSRPLQSASVTVSQDNSKVTSLCRRPPLQNCVYIETEIRRLLKENAVLANSLYMFLIRNGFHPTDSIKHVLAHSTSVHWVEEYTHNAAPLSDICVKLLRSYLYVKGNILFGCARLVIPQRIKDQILMKHVI